MTEACSILIEGDTVWRRAAADRLAFLVDGEEYFAALRESLIRAERSVVVLAWVIDSRLRLLRGADDDGYPRELGDLLVRLVEERPDLEIRISCWDHSLIFASDRELLTRAWLGWTTPERLHFELDSNHAAGASLHEKLVVVDDEVAFIGGIDPGRYRWDTSAHRPEDPRRVAPTGEHYPPVHDVMAVLSGGAARVLGEHARRRWQRLTGEIVDAASPLGDPWPAAVAPAVGDVELGIVRTRAAHGGRREVRETERLLLRMIAEAERHVFIENQYLSAEVISAAIAGRLAEEDAPEIVAVTSKESDGWLEQLTIDGLRARWCREVRAADRSRRFHPCYPVNGGGEPVSVHCKLLSVDDRLLYLGSANLANRSMFLDSECGIALDAGGREDVRRAVRALRQRLLAEHLGVEASRIDAAETDRSLGEVVEDLAGDPPTLETLRAAGREVPAVLEPVIRLADPSQIPTLNWLARELIGGEADPE